MGSLVGAGQLVLLTFFLFFALGSATCALAAPGAVRRVASLPPRVAAGRLLALALLPVAAGGAMTLVAFVPSVAASILGVEHHCESHLGHPHLCVVHLPASAGGLAGWIALGVAALALAHRARPGVRELVRARALLAGLTAASSPEGLSHWRRLPTSEPVCAAIGWLRPRVLVSDGFRAGLSSSAFDAALAHELEHARRRDAWWQVLARASTVALPAPVRSELLSALAFAAERTCDEAAAHHVGDRLVVAEAILQAQRLGLAAPAAGCAAFGPLRWEQRVRALLAAPSPPPVRWARWDLAAIALALLCLTLAGPLHHAAESVLAILSA